MKTSLIVRQLSTVRKMSKYGPENTPYLDTFHAVKVDPIYDELLKNCQQFGIFDKLLSVDESIVLYRRNFSIKQNIRNKPIRFGYKFWFLCGADGYPHNFELYKGKDEERRKPLGTSVVKRISVVKNEKFKYMIHFNNFFTSYSLLVDLAARNLRAIGKVR